MRGFMSNIDDDDLRNSMDTRNSTVNRPDIDPGMEEDEDDDWGKIGGSDSFDSDNGWSNSFGGRSGDSSFGDSRFGGGGGFSQQYGSPYERNQNNQTNQEVLLPEDKFFGEIGKVLKGCLNFIKEAVTAFKDFDTLTWMYFGRNVIATSALLVVVSLVTLFLGVEGSAMVTIGSLFSLGIGTIVFMFMMAKLKELEESGVGIKKSVTEEVYADAYENEEEDEIDTEDFWSSKKPEFEEEPEEWDTFGSDSDLEEEKPLFVESKGFDYSEDVDDQKSNPLDVLDRLNNDSYGMSRQYLFEAITACLPHKKKNFADTVELDEDSREFLAFCSMIEKTCGIVAPKNISDTVQLISAKDKLFYTLLELERPNWLTATVFKKFLEELTNLCSFDPKTLTSDPSVFGTGTVVGNRAYVKMMKGENAFITLKDTFAIVKEEFLNPDNKMPVVLGIDAEGSVVWQDFKDVHSMLIAGEPRSGKSWTMLSILSQLMMFCSPFEVNFICFDPKDKTGDLCSLTSPHVIKFTGNDDEILRTLNWVINVEAKRREQLLYDTGRYKDIKDLKKEHPEIKMPYLYVVIDEIITLSERMSKEQKDEFQSYLTELTTRLPSYGIRIMMLPHVIKNSVISKTTTDSIPIRLCVRGNADSIEHVTGVKEKDFKYKLSHQGDIAAKLDNTAVQFVHSAVVSDTNKGTAEVFDFLTNLWLKLEPESFKGSKLEKDIKAGIRNKSEFLSLKDIDLDYIEEEKTIRNSSRPKRSRVTVEPAHSQKDNDTDTEEEVSSFEKTKDKNKNKIQREDDY